MTVASLIADATTRTTDLTTTASEALADANTAINSIPRTVTIFNGITQPNYQPPADLDPFPNIPLVAFTAGAAPALTPTVAIPAVNTAGAPTLSAKPLSYTPPSKPSSVADFAATAPTIDTNLAFPTAPSLIMPLTPTLPTRIEPTAPQVSLPAFNALAPTDSAVAPTGLDSTFARAQEEVSISFVKNVEAYVAVLMKEKFPAYEKEYAIIRMQLDKYFLGGTALKPAVEQAIYDRGRAKNDLETKRVQDAAFSDFAARGFTMPPGALSSTLALARRDAANNNAKMVNEIAIMQAEMEQKNLQFAMNTITGLQKVAVDTMLGYTQNLISLNGQSIQYAQGIVSALIEVYNGQVKMFTSRVEAYRAQAAVYETQLKGAMAGVELYKAQIDALQALTQVDAAAVNVFRARIEALNTQSVLYRSQIEAVQAQASLEKLKIDVFQSQVQAYAAQVQAKNAEYQGYTAQIEGEVSKTKIYAAQVEAYSAQVQGYKANVEAGLAAVQAAAATNQAIGQTNQSNLLAYKATVEAQGEVARAQVAVGQTAIHAYEAAAHANIAKASAAAEYYKASTSVALGEAQLAVTTAMESAKINLATGEAIAKVATANATIYGNLAGSAMAGMNTLAAESVIS